MRRLRFIVRLRRLRRRLSARSAAAWAGCYLIGLATGLALQGPVYAQAPVPTATPSELSLTATMPPTRTVLPSATWTATAWVHTPVPRPDPWPSPNAPADPEVQISIATWLVALPQHAQGLLVYYGPQYVVEAVADFRGYDLTPYRERCGVSGVSPSDMGRIVWVREHDGSWYGPCLILDESARQDFYANIYQKRSVLEVSDNIRARLGFTNGQWGEIWVGLCPPAVTVDPPMLYAPPLIWDMPPLDTTPSMYPYPEQQWPENCE